MSLLTIPQHRFISDHGVGQVWRRLHNNQNAFYALRSFQPGELIAEFSAGTIASEPTYLTVQVDVGKHITLQPEFLQYINHSCAPNTFFNTTTMQVTALKHIAFEEELSFFYPSTEWMMQQPFKCYCGSPACLGEIKGAAFLPKNVLKQYRFTDFIQQQLAKRPARKVA